MDATLAALHAAVIDAPADRTVRLVYADALDESGDPANAARAEFIRDQVELETLPDADPRRPALVSRCEELFADHWIDWWRPVCAAVGLPEPYVPSGRLRERVKRLTGREKRRVGAPYARSADTPGAFSISCEEHGFTAQFIAGFPELLYVHRFTIDTITGQVGTWLAGAPFGRLRFAEDISEFEWESVNGPHLAKLSELAFDQISLNVAGEAARSPHLAALATLKVATLGPVANVVRLLVCRPAWAGLRALTLTGVSPPAAIQTLAESCTLGELESLSLGICEVPAVPVFGGLTGAVGALLTEMMARFLGGRPAAPGPIRWSDYWPALEALARSPVLSRLRTLRVTDAGPHPYTLGGFFRQLGQPDDPGPIGLDSIFPDTLVRALADGLNADKLVRLELPAARLAPAGRAELTRRFGQRSVLA